MTTLKAAVLKAIESSDNVVLFHEGIKTNGLGTVKPSKRLSERLLDLEMDFVICQLRYWSSIGISSMVSHPLALLFRLMRAPKVSMKVRSKAIDYSSVHSKAEMLNELHDFIKMHSSKLVKLV